MLYRVRTGCTFGQFDQSPRVHWSNWPSMRPSPFSTSWSRWMFHRLLTRHRTRHWNRLAPPHWNPIPVTGLEAKRPLPVTATAQHQA